MLGMHAQMNEWGALAPKILHLGMMQNALLLAEMGCIPPPVFIHLQTGNQPVYQEGTWLASRHSTAHERTQERLSLQGTVSLGRVWQHLLLPESFVKGKEGRLQRSFRALPVPLPLQEARKVLRCKVRCLPAPMAVKNTCTYLPSSRKLLCPCSKN